MYPERNSWGLFIVRWGNQPANVLSCVEYAIKMVGCSNTAHTVPSHVNEATLMPES